MVTYRIFGLEGGAPFERLEYDADDDAEALALFGLRGEKEDCNLYCGVRKVATIMRGNIPRWALPG